MDVTIKGYDDNLFMIEVGDNGDDAAEGGVCSGVG